MTLSDVLFDECDRALFESRRWRLHGGSRIHKYVATTTRKVEMFHRLIMDAKKGEIVDHINGNTLDNRRSNLRICTHAENMRNSAKRMTGLSKYKGVSRMKNGRWISMISANRKQKYLGCFQSEIDAAQAYDNAAKKLHGEFARVNFGGNK